MRIFVLAVLFTFIQLSVSAQDTILVDWDDVDEYYTEQEIEDIDWKEDSLAAVAFAAAFKEENESRGFPLGFFVILGVIFLPLFAWPTYIYITKSNKFKWAANKAKKALDRAEAQDKVWKREYLIQLSEAYFKIVSQALSKNDIGLVKEYLDDHCFKKLNKEVAHYRRNGMYNYRSHMNITFVDIVEVCDYLDNTQDNFKAFIQGSMVNEMKKVGFRPGLDAKVQDFAFLLHFRRFDKDWLLHDLEEISIAFDETRIQNVSQK